MNNQRAMLKLTRSWSTLISGFVLFVACVNMKTLKSRLTQCYKISGKKLTSQSSDTGRAADSLRILRQTRFFYIIEHTPKFESDIQTN